MVKKEVPSQQPILPLFTCSNCSCDKKKDCCKKYKRKGYHCKKCPKL